MTLEPIQFYISTVMEEYKSLRDESKQASINMFTALQWGSAIIGLLFAAGFTQWNREHAVVLVIFLILIPTVGAVTMFLWLGEAMRFKRAGDYICLIEAKIALVVEQHPELLAIRSRWATLQRQEELIVGLPQSSLNLGDALAWERWLRDARAKGGTAGHLTLVYLIRFLFFPWLMMCSGVVGTYYALTHEQVKPTVPAFARSFENRIVGAVSDVHVGTGVVILIGVALALVVYGVALVQLRHLQRPARYKSRNPTQRVQGDGETARKSEAGEEEHPPL